MRVQVQIVSKLFQISFFYWNDIQTFWVKFFCINEVLGYIDNQFTTYLSTMYIDLTTVLWVSIPNTIKSIYMDEFVKNWLAIWPKNLAFVFFHHHLSIYAKKIAE